MSRPRWIRLTNFRIWTTPISSWRLDEVAKWKFSIWNASSRDFNMSKLDLSEHKTEDLKDINLTVDKLKQLTKKIKEVK